MDARNELIDKNNGANKNILKGRRSIASGRKKGTTYGNAILDMKISKIMQIDKNKDTLIDKLIFLSLAIFGKSTVDKIEAGFTNTVVNLEPKS